MSENGNRSREGSRAAVVWKGKGMKGGNESRVESECKMNDVSKLNGKTP